MKIRNVQKTLLGTAIAMAIGTVYAQQDPSPQDLLRQHDRDSNQSLSNEEFQELYRAQAGSQQDNIEEQAEQTFERADLDGNGELAMSELRQAMPLTEPQADQRGVAGQNQSDDPQQRGIAGQNQSDDPQQRGSTTDARSQATDDQPDARGIAGTPQSRTDDQSRTGQTRTERQQDGVAQTQPDQQRYQRGDDPNNRSLSQTDQDRQAGQRSTDQDRSTVTQRSQSSQSSTLEMTARQSPDELEGREIQNSQQEEVGEIERVVRHTRSGDLYVVVTSGGFAGFGEDRSVILITELQEQGDMIIFTGQQEQMQAYEESQYEEFNAETAQIEVQETERTVASLQQDSSQQAGQSQNAEEMAKQQPNELQGKEVRNSQSGDKVGEIEMVVLDKQNNEFHVVLSADEILGVGGDDMVVAVTELESDGDAFILNSEQSAQPFSEQNYLKVEEI